MKAIVTYWMNGVSNAASDALRVEKPPVDMVVKACVTASNVPTPPTMKSAAWAIVRPR